MVQQKRAGVQKQRKISVRVTDPLNRKLPSITNSISPLNLMPIHTIKWRLPTFLNSNTRSIMNKIDEITNLIDVNHVDIACVTETWLSDEVPPCVTGIDGYTCERRDRVDRRGGGVLIYIRNGIPYRRIENLECDEVESLWLLVRDKCMPRGFSHILIGVVYHPPGACNLTTTNHIITSLDDIIKKHPHAGVMLLGDFNKLNDTQLRSYPLKQVVKLPTRRTAILDKIFTNMGNLYDKPIVLAPSSFSDHNVVLFEPAPSLKFDAGKTVSINIRVSSQRARDNLSNCLAGFDWTPLYLQPSCEKKFEFFQSSMSSIINQHLPTRVVRRHTSDKPWVTDYFRQLIKQRQRAYLCGNSIEYRMLRNKVIRSASSIRSSYYQEQLSNLRNCDPRRWWKHTKSLTGLGKTSSEFYAMANSLCGGDLGVLAGEINSFFESVCRDLDPIDVSIVPLDCPVPLNYTIDTDTVLKLLAKINVNKTIGPDDIPSWILRDHALILAHPVCTIFNASIREGFVPTIWKSANVIPIPKANPPRVINKDLRPISLTAVLSKSLERIVGGWMLDLIFNKLDSNQYGGLKGSSTTHALVDMVHTWLLAAEERKASHVVLLDYRKAFDHVDHTVLVTKCKHFDLPNFIIRWLCAFLSNRSQRVRLGRELSDWVSLKGSVPQGSWLGPLLFIILINDLRLPCAVHKYMDDTTLTTQVQKGSVGPMQTLIDQTVSWSSANKMIPNIDKTKDMIISFLKQPMDIPPVTIQGIDLERVSSVKLLGIIINNKLTWTENTTYICSKASKRLYHLKQLRRAGLSGGDLLMFYGSVIRPVIEYACPVWHSSLTVADSAKIESIQRRAMRIIDPSLCYDAACNKHHLDKTSVRRENLSMRFFSAIKSASHKLNYLLPKPKITRYSLRNSSKLPLPKTKTNRFKNSLIPYGLYNFQ